MMKTIAVYECFAKQDKFAWTNTLEKSIPTDVVGRVDIEYASS